jgi:glycosyltransferase involved in cell wall biosynthesis
MYLKTKNICLFNSCKNWGGGEKWHFEIAKLLKEKGYNVLLFTNIKSDLYEKVVHSTIPVYAIKISNLSFLNPFKILKIKQILKKHEIQTIILGLPSDVKIAGISAKLAGIHKIIYRRGTALPIKNTWLNKFIFKYIITDIITNSLEIQKKILERNPLLFPINNIHIIYNSIQINGFEPKPPTFLTNPRQFIIGNMGRLVEQKGQKYLIELASILKDRGLNFKLLIAGKGKLKNQLHKLAEEYNVTQNIEFLDFVEDIEQFYKSIDIYVLTSIHEGSANTLIEAMYYAKPIITFNISSMPELVDHGVTGYLVKFGDITDLSEKVLFLANNPKLIFDMGLAAKQKVSENFNINNTLLQLESIL